MMKDNKKILEKIIGNNEIAELYFKNQSGFVVCSPLGMDERWLYIISIDPHGFYAGYAVIPISSILKISIKTKYLLAIKRLQDYHGEKISAINIKDNFIYNILSYAEKNNKVIWIKYIDKKRISYERGIITELCLKKITIVRIYLGEKKRSHTVLIADIRELSFDGPYDRTEEILYNN